MNGRRGRPRRTSALGVSLSEGRGSDTPSACFAFRGLDGTLHPCGCGVCDRPEIWTMKLLRIYVCTQCHLCHELDVSDVTLTPNYFTCRGCGGQVMPVAPQKI
jgi:hypothetical protein